MDDDTHEMTRPTIDQDEDHRDAMEVDGAPSMMVDTIRSHPTESVPLDTDVDTGTDALASDTPRGSRSPPVFDEDAERPRQRRRYHVTVQDETDPEARATVGSPAATTTTTTTAADGANAGEDEVAILEAVPPRMSDLSIHTPRSNTPPPAAPVPAAMQQDAAPSSTLEVPPAPSGTRSPQSPHLGTVPLPDVPTPPRRNSNGAPETVMEAARRLTAGPDAGTADQLQADLALLAPYIAAQAMAAAFQPGGRPPGEGTQAPPGPAQPPQAGGQAGPGIPPFPVFPFGFPFMFGSQQEAPADPKRAERLANGLQVVEDGLLKRWQAVCGEEGAICAVCYSELLEEPGIEKEKEKEVKADDEDKDKQGEHKPEEIVGDEAVHERALREALERREQMERLEKEEKERKLETAVLAFPCAHVFHRTCLLPWLSRHTTCPTCRFDIDPKSDTLTLPADEPLLGPNGFNLGEMFTVGPVLRVPRTHAPRLGPRPAPRPRPDQPNSGDSEPRPSGADANAAPVPTTDTNESRPPSSDNPPRPEPPRDQSRSRPLGTPGPSPSMADLFEGLFGPLFESAGIPGPRRTNSTEAPLTTDQRPATSELSTETPSQSTTGQSSAPESSTLEPATRDATAPQGGQESSTSTTPRTDPSQAAQTTPGHSADMNDPPALRARPRAPIPTDYRPIDYSRPLAMFARPSPRRPVQPITPAWMRTPRPPVPLASADAASSGPSTAGSASTAMTSVTESTTHDPPRGFNQIRSIVSNLIPRRLSSSRPVLSSAASVRSQESGESTHATSTRSVSNPLAPRTGLRAILHGPTAMLRDLASRRPAEPESEPTSGPRDSVDSVAPEPDNDQMPGLEDDTERGSNYSEDDAHRSNEDEDEDMPPLEPIAPREPAAPEATTSNDQPTATESTPAPRASSPVQSSEGDDDDMPQLEPIAPRPSRTNTQSADAENGAQPPPLVPPPPRRTTSSRSVPGRRASEPGAGGPRPAGENANNLMDNIITLRIDLGHADGRDETIIVPLLFNPVGRNGRPPQPPPPPPRARTPPPQKKWIPPEPVKTFRQVVEEKEREAGWRCDDPACLLGPADDEEPAEEHVIKPMYSIMRSLAPDGEPVRYKIEDGIRVYAGGEDVRVKGENPVCAHQLHPECLVTSARINGWGPEHNSQSTSRITLRCPVCRLEGTVERDIWNAGVEAEEAGES